MLGENSRHLSIRDCAIAAWLVATVGRALGLGLSLVLALASSTVFAQSQASTGSNPQTLATGSAAGRLDTLSVSGEAKLLLVDAMRNKVYVGSTGSSVTVLDGNTNAATEVVTGSSPEALAVSPVTNQVYAVNSQEPVVTVIDGTSENVNTLDLEAYPRDVAVNAATNRVYVTTTNPSTVTVINSLTDSLVGSIALTVVPGTIAVNPATNTIYVASPASSRLLVIDGATNAITGTVAVGDSVGSLAVDPTANRVYAINEGDNTVTVVDGASSTVVATISTGNGPSAVAVNPITSQVYVANMNDDSVTVIDGRTTAATTLALPGVNSPRDVAVDPAVNRIYVVGESSGNVAVIEGATNAVTTLADATASQSVAVTVNPLTGKVYVANQASSNVTIVSTQPEQTNTLVASVAPLAGNLSASLMPAFDFKATSTPPVTVGALFYQVDTQQGTWLAASSLGSGSFTGKTAALQPGFHVLYAYATGGAAADSRAAAQAESFHSSIAAYGFVVAPPSAAVSSLSLDFGYQRRGVPSAARTVTLSNLGGGPLTLSTVAADGDFTTSDNCGSILAAFASCPIDVIFTPKGKGKRLGALTITGGEALTTGRTVTLIGDASTGPVPQFSNTQSTGSSTLQFSPQLVGTNTTLTETLTNIGDATMPITGLGISAGTLDFSATNNCPSSLGIGSSCTITVKFAPSTGGTLYGVFTVNYTGTSGVASASFGINGIGEDFTYDPAPPSSGSASVAAGGSASITFKVVPEGGFNQTVSLSCTTAALDTTCVLTPSSVSLQDGTTSVSVTAKLTTTARSHLAPGPRATPPASGRPQVPVALWWSLVAFIPVMVLARRRGLRLRWLLLPAILMFILMWAACGGNGGVPSPSTGTPAGSWVVTITGTAGSLSNTTYLTLNVS